jgi:hypothetical protein
MGKLRYKQFKEGTIGTLWWFDHEVPDLPDQHIQRSVLGKQHIIRNQGNRYWKLGSEPWVGGNFLLEKHELGADNPVTVPEVHGGGFRRYIGDTYAMGSVGVGSWPIALSSSDSELEAFGTTAIANVEPTNPVSNLLGALGELKADGLPSAFGVSTWRDRTHLAKSAGSEYLNVQFGWKPLLSDIRGFSNAVTNSDELVQQYSRNSGRKIKREFTLPGATTSDTTHEEGGYYSFPGHGPAFLAHGQKRDVFHRITTRKWFSGEFTYYLPPVDPNGDNFTRNRQIAEYLFGARVTPELVWDLTPWTWAVDWMGNFGDVLHNVGAFAANGLVLNYGYAMEEVISEQTTTVSDIEFNDMPGVKLSCSTTLRTVVKKRIKATPYGFGLDVGSFTPQQTAILVALGISRG